MDENLSVNQAQERLPLFRSIAVELQDRVTQLQDMAALVPQGSPGDVRRLRDRVRECVAELECLGAEVDGFRPVSLLVPVRLNGGDEQWLSWQVGETAFEPAEQRV